MYFPGNLSKMASIYKIKTHSSTGARLARYRQLYLTVTCVLCGGLTAFGQAPATQPSHSVWQEMRNNPNLQFLASLFESKPVLSPMPVILPPASDVNACPVAALEKIDDPAALQLEAAGGSEGVVDVANMLPAAARALGLFQARVTKAGGTLIVKSAYRPYAYQKHLQDVWYKWMSDLRENRNPACQQLRAEVQAEFDMHHLIERQHPVAVSDHTRGIAFDATVALPVSKRGRRGGISLDRLARLVGLFRPAIAADPVHFKYQPQPVRTASVRRRIRASA
jgi:hypothetical protein